MVLMFVAIIPSATAVGVLAAAAVEKLFFAVIGVLVFVYLFLSVGGNAYSVGQQLLTTVWNIAFAAVLVAVAFAGREGSASCRSPRPRPGSCDPRHGRERRIRIVSDRDVR
jgi:hypothetical protein